MTGMATDTPEQILFPELLRRFRANTARKQPEHMEARFRGLVIPGSLQASTAALLIAHFNPEVVAFLLTKQSSAMPDAVEHLLAELAPDGFQLRAERAAWKTPEGDYLSPLAVYKGLRDIVREWTAQGYRPDEIAADVTGGKVPMTAGLAKAAHILGLATVYVDSEYKGNRYVDGSQWLELPPDPYLVFGDIERDEAREFFRSHDYATAARLFKGLADRLKDAKEDGLWAALATAYADWEAFDLAKAEAGLRAVLAGHAAALSEQQTRRIDAHLAALAAVRPLVEACRPERGQPETRGQAGTYKRAMNDFGAQQLKRLTAPATDDRPATAPALLAMLYANGLRRQAQGRLDTAALLLYRCLELMSQERLAHRGVFAEWCRDALQSLAKAHPALGNIGAVRNQKGSVALYDGYAILKALGDPFAEKLDLERIGDRTDARNRSLFAHGFSYIGETTFKEFLTLVDDTLVHWCTVGGVDWARTLERATFLHLDAE